MKSNTQVIKTNGKQFTREDSFMVNSGIYATYEDSIIQTKSTLIKCLAMSNSEDIKVIALGNLAFNMTKFKRNEFNALYAVTMCALSDYFFALAESSENDNDLYCNTAKDFDHIVYQIHKHSQSKK